MDESSHTLADLTCKPYARGAQPLPPEEIQRLLGLIDGWIEHDGTISKTFSFRDYWETMAFVNATAWISHRQDHHPDLHVSYKSCRIDYRTHAVDGLSENDFICAAKVDALLRS